MNAIDMNNTKVKYPLIYMLKIKRGVAWSTRRIELDREKLKYFKTDDNELRFDTKIDDCTLKEKHPENVKKMYLVLESKTKNFTKVKIRNDDVKTIKQFKKDFDSILLYNSTLNNIQNKTFIIQSDKKAISNDTVEVNDDNVARSFILNDEITEKNSDLISSLYKEPLSRNKTLQSRNSFVPTNNINLDSKERDSRTMNEVEILKYSSTFSPSVRNTITGTKEVETEVFNEEINFRRKSGFTSEKSTPHVIPETFIQSKPESGVRPPQNSLMELIKGINTDDWVKIKYTGNSLIEYNGNKKNILSLLSTISDEHMVKQEILKNYFDYLKQAFEQFIENQINSLIFVFILFLLSLALVFIFNMTYFLINLTTCLIFFIVFIRSCNKKTLTTYPTNDLSEDSEKFSNLIKITSTFNDHPKEILSYLTNIKSYRDWNLYLKSVSDFKKEDNSANYSYLKTLKEEDGDCIIRIKRKIIQNTEPIIIVDETNNSKVRVTIIDTSINSNKSKVSVYIPLRNIFDKKIPISFFKSNLKSLDMLHNFINNKNFNSHIQDRDEKEFGELLYNKVSNVIKNTFDSQEKVSDDIKISETKLENSNKEAVSNVNNLPLFSAESDDVEITESNTINLKENFSQNKNIEENNQQKLETAETGEKIPNSVNDFSDINNKFSEEKRKTIDSKIKITPENIAEPEISEISKNEILSKNTININEKKNENNDNISVIDPIIQKENESVKNLIQTKLSELDGFLKREWKSMEEKSDYKLYYIDEKSGIRSIKSEALINTNIKIVWDYVMDPANRTKFDKNFDCGHYIRVIDSSYSIDYKKYKGKLFVNPRDFTLCTWHKIDENEAIVISTSFNTEKFPKVNKVERADLIIGGYILKKLDDFKTHLTYFTSSDLKISQTLVNVTLKEVAMQVKYIKDDLVKNK